MTHVGLIFVGYGTKDLLDKSLTPWIALRKDPEYKVSICAVSLRFAGFEGEDDGTGDALRGYLERGEIDNLITEPDDIPETQARGMALTWLKEQGVEMTWMVDADEEYTQDEIYSILSFVKSNPWSAWFRVSLRNMVFDDKTYLAEPFQPPRIHRVNVGGYKAHSFGADNDIQYGGTITRDIIHQSQFANMTIPPQVAFVRHYSWPNSARSRNKVRYQESRNWQCSFSWDDTQGGLIFNPALPRPKTISE